MIGVYPNYIGPFQRESVYPRWTGGDLFEIEVEVPGGGGSKRARDELKSTALGRRLIREDEELLAIIMAAMRVMQ